VASIPIPGGPWWVQVALSEKQGERRVLLTKGVDQTFPWPIFHRAIYTLSKEPEIRGNEVKPESEGTCA